MTRWKATTKRRTRSVKLVALDLVPLLRGRALKALRAIAANPGGLRMNAHPSAVPLLLELGLVRVRERGEPAWLLTVAGRQVVAERGLGET